MNDKLWSDLKTMEERIAFLKSGRASVTGIIAPVMIAEIVKALEENINFRNLLKQAAKEIEDCYNSKDIQNIQTTLTRRIRDVIADV